MQQELTPEEKFRLDLKAFVSINQVVRLHNKPKVMADESLRKLLVDVFLAGVGMVIDELKKTKK